MILYRKRYAVNSWVDAPTVVISAAWIAIWLLFGSVDNAQLFSGDPVTECSVVFIDSRGGDIDAYMNPALPPSPSSSLINEVDLQKRVQVKTRDISHLLAREPETGFEGDIDADIIKKAVEDMRMRGYSTRWPDPERSTENVIAYVRPVEIDASAGLSKRDFHVPSLAVEGLMKLTGAWEITAQLEFNSEGEVEHVFLLSPTKDKGINSKVERMLYQSVIHSGGRDVTGVVVVSFRGEK